MSLYQNLSRGPEFARVVSYQLVGGDHSVPILAEGLSEFLVCSGREMHERLSYESRIVGQRTPFRIEGTDLSRGSDQRDFSCVKAGSFVKFLVEDSGWIKFKELYKATMETGRLPPDERLPQFFGKFTEIYGKSLETAEAGWNKAVSPFNVKTLPLLSPEEEMEVRALFTAQDTAVKAGDGKAFSGTYDSIERMRINCFGANLKYHMEKLLATEIRKIYDMGIRNGHGVLVCITRRFRDGTARNIEYYVEKHDGGWKIQSENWK